VNDSSSLLDRAQITVCGGSAFCSYVCISLTMIESLLSKIKFFLGNLKLLCKVHGPHCHLKSVQQCKIFPHLINGTKFRQNVIEHKMCVLIPLQLLSKTFFILRRTEWRMIINIYIVLHVKYTLFVLDYDEFEFLKKCSNRKFDVNLSSGNWDVSCGRMDQHDETNSLSLQFCECT